ncbi:MAG: hypothetical protein RIQ81_2324 [Pseudomonadota bacterium]|jgi:metallophosphoesterase (TIGR00282 family)
MRILAIGDVMGKAGRQALSHFLPGLRRELNPDVVLVNGENAAGGFGLTEKIYDQFITQMEIDCITMGNHWHDKREFVRFAEQAPRMVLPANMMNVNDPSKGVKVLRSRSGKEFAVMNVIGKAFMHPDNHSPFPFIERMLDMIPAAVRVRILDVHAEATSEKQGIGQHLAGRVSLVYGTHSHVPTADERIIDKKTGFITDLGMTGPYDSVIGIRKEAAIKRLMTGEKQNFQPASGNRWLCAVVTDIDESTGHCQRISRIRLESEETDKGKERDDEP